VDPSVAPHGAQRLLRIADRDADAVRHELRSYAVERLGLGGVLMVDETGFVERAPARPGHRLPSASPPSWQAEVGRTAAPRARTGAGSAFSDPPGTCCSIEASSVPSA
jgi:hypothetical protein